MIGVFLNGELMSDYPDDVVCFEEALKDALEFTQDTGLLHEVKRF